MGALSAQSDEAFEETTAIQSMISGGVPRSTFKFSDESQTIMSRRNLGHGTLMSTTVHKKGSASQTLARACAVAPATTCTSRKIAASNNTYIAILFGKRRSRSALERSRYWRGSKYPC
jgi:hypothetical protein